MTHAIQPIDDPASAMPLAALVLGGSACGRCGDDRSGPVPTRWFHADYVHGKRRHVMGETNGRVHTRSFPRRQRVSSAPSPLRRKSALQIGRWLKSSSHRVSASPRHWPPTPASVDSQRMIRADRDAANCLSLTVERTGEQRFQSDEQDHVGQAKHSACVGFATSITNRGQQGHPGHRRVMYVPPVEHGQGPTTPRPANVLWSYDPEVPRSSA